MTNNQSNELEVMVGMLRQWLNEERITDPKKLVTNDELWVWLKPIKDRERLAEGRGRTAVLTSMKEWADDTELTYNNFMRDELEKLEQLKGEDDGR